MKRNANEVAQHAGNREQLKEELRALRREAERRQKKADQKILRREKAFEPVPLSFAQERLWYLDQMGLVGAAYNVPLALRLSGNLDEQALERSFAALVQRHESLRTRFVVTDGTPCQVIDDSEEFGVSLVDLTEINEIRERDLSLHRVILGEQNHRFTLSKGPLIRVVLVRLAPAENALVITLHHIVSDGWSLSVLTREVSALYATFTNNGVAPLPQLEVQYADYSIWQRDWIGEDGLRDQLKYWSAQLDGAPEQLKLPTDRPRPLVESFKGAHVKFEVSAPLADSLGKLGRDAGATLFMVIMAAYQSLLSRYTGESDILVGSAVAGRRNGQTDNLIGFFVNTLVFRTEVDDRMTFGELLARVVNVTLDAYAHQDLPFEKLVRELRPERSLARQPIFQVALGLRNFPHEEISLAGIDWKPIEITFDTALFDLTLHVSRERDGLDCYFEYATDLFDESTIRRFAVHFQKLLQGVVDNPQLEIGRQWLSEKSDLPASQEGPIVDPPPNLDVVSLLETQARQRPNAVALRAGGRTLTYRSLNAAASRLARRLADCGVKPGSRVGVYMKRGLECLVSFYGILKAGAVYVPLDPLHPRSRLRSICVDADIGHVTVAGGKEDTLDLSMVQSIVLDQSDVCDSIESPDVGPSQGTELSMPAYIIYTSGSTGKPKGVVLHRKGLANVVLAQRTTFSLTDADGVAQLAAISFDASVFEFVLALGVGAELCIGSQEDSLPGSGMRDFLNLNGVSVMVCTPSALASLTPNSVPSLRALIVAGEQLPAELSRKWIGKGRIFNAYGPTESTIWSTFQELDAKSMRSHVPIGMPIQNTQVYVLDSWLRPVPIGVRGDLYISSVGLAYGYIKQAALTAERFVANPFGPAGSRLYRTGDIGRRIENGALEFLGRDDSQLKIRGHRIELGEIESLLLQHPAVEQAVLLVQGEKAAADSQLVCYVVGNHRAYAANLGVISGEGLNDSEAVVGDWQELHDDTYSAAEFRGDPSFSGWNSSYTGLPIPELEMEEWLAATVNRIRDLKPSRVLEIGCGVGLIVERLAPSCVAYVATDLSENALKKLRGWANGREELRHLQLLHCSATQLDQLKPGSFDTIILNSVVQYFPDVDYLLRVLRSVIPLLIPGGSIFLGDIRNFGLLETFHSAVELAKSAATASVAELRGRISFAVDGERELTVSPQLFWLFQRERLDIANVSVQLKRGVAENELTLYRYDVTMTVGGHNFGYASQRRVFWSDVRSIERLEVLLQQKEFDALELLDIPNKRLARELAIQRLIETSDERLEVGALIHELNHVTTEGIDPEVLWTLGERLGFDVSVTPFDNGRVSATIIQRTELTKSAHRATSSRVLERSFEDHANDPLGSRFRERLIPHLREYLRERLPPYMVPSSWMSLKSMPLTSSGKIDRRKLQSLQIGDQPTRNVAAPQGDTERALAEIWRELLRIGRVGRADGFFELGGHSLLALKAVSMINRRFGSELRITDLYRYQTVEELAARINNPSSGEAFVCLKAESSLDPVICALPGVPRTPAKAILLTGATGFVGRFLLAQLLRDTSALIYCLIRAPSQREAASRLRSTLRSWNLWNKGCEQRVVPINGDLSRSGLGIDAATRETLITNVDVIYHCGASMNHLETYTMAKPANVDGLRELLILATTWRPMTVNYISSLGVFSSSSDSNIQTVDENSSIDDERHRASSGYVASKWVGERLVLNASSRGIPCNIFRLGHVWADTKQGRFDEQQHSYMVLKTCLLSGYGIKNYTYAMAPTPVDYVAQAVVFLAGKSAVGGRVYHISSSKHISDGLFECLNGIDGDSLTLLSLYDWTRGIQRIHDRGQTLPAVPLLQSTFSMDEQSFNEYHQKSRLNIEIDCARTHRELEEAGIVAPVLNDEMLRICIEDMRSRDVTLRKAHALRMVQVGKSAVSEKR